MDDFIFFFYTVCGEFVENWFKCSYFIINRGWWWSRLYFIIYICIYMNLYVYDYVMVSVLVILRSTTGPYGPPILEVAYGEMLCSLHRGCMGVDSSGRMVGVSTWCRPCWTYPGQHQCGLTVYCFGFSYYTSIKYIYKWFSNLYAV